LQHFNGGAAAQAQFLKAMDLIGPTQHLVDPGGLATSQQVEGHKLSNHRSIEIETRSQNVSILRLAERRSNRRR
jgi:hypothetical protein